MPEGLKSRITAAAGALGVSLALLTAVPASASGAGEESHDVDTQLAIVRFHTAKYHDINVAIRDGYHAPHPYVCVDSDEGTMGYHYLKWDRLDNKLDIRRPELLIYVPEDDGEMLLVAVEYMKPDNDQDLSTDDDRPTLFKQPFQGPMEGHEPGMPRHYDLHVWVWSDNPNGMFAQWNPAISC